MITANKDQSVTAFKSYLESIASGLPVDKAIQFAASHCTVPAELDKLQCLINQQHIEDTIKEMHDFLENCIKF